MGLTLIGVAVVVVVLQDKRGDVEDRGGMLPKNKT